MYSFDLIDQDVKFWIDFSKIGSDFFHKNFLDFMFDVNEKLGIIK